MHQQRRLAPWNRHHERSPRRRHPRAPHGSHMESKPYHSAKIYPYSHISCGRFVGLRSVSLPSRFPTPPSPTLTNSFHSTCAAAIVRVWAILNIDQTDVTWSYVRPLIWSSVEISIGITCACLPTLQPLIQLCLSSRSTSNLSRKYPINHNNNDSHNYYNNHNTINNKIITSAWASKEDLREGAGEGASEGMSTRSDDNDEVPLNGIRVLSQVKVERRDSGSSSSGGGGGSGGLSPV